MQRKYISGGRRCGARGVWAHIPHQMFEALFYPNELQSVPVVQLSLVCSRIEVHSEKEPGR